MNPDTSPEIKLLLHCARTRMESQRAEFVRTLLSQKLDWQYLMKEARRHVIGPLLYHHLKTRWPASAPEEYLRELHECYCNNATRNLFLANELVRLIQLLEQQGISTVPYKGPVLASSIYGNLSLREFADLDIFVRKQDVLKIQTILISEGYRLIPSEKRQAYQLKHKYHFPFLHPETGIRLEIHWAFTKRYWAFEFTKLRLWERLKPVELTGASVSNFSAEDLILILCMHGAKHGWERLAWICDIAELIRSETDLDWSQVLEQSKRTGTRRVLLIGLSMAHDLLEAVLPDQILSRISADSTARSISTNLQRQICSDQPSMQGARYFIQTRERLRDKTIALLYFLRVSLHKTLRITSS